MTVPFLSEDQVKERISAGLRSEPLQDKRVLVVIPDPTRTMPLPLFFRTIVEELQGRTRQVDFIVALGTHPPLSESELLSLVGITPAEKAEKYSRVNLLTTPGRIHPRLHK